MNFGHWYYREYFDTINLDSKGIVTNFSTFNKGKNDKLIKGATLPPYDKENDIEDVTSFELKTCYPGLLCGVGYHHEINNPKNEPKEDDAPEVYNLGMYFDYTSGLPVIPGSSIKGMLRSAIEEWDFLADYELNNGVTREEIIEKVFVGKEYSIYDRDIFLDAIPIKADNKLFGEDYITHHPTPLQNPNPVRFLRVNPGVTYQFRFILRNNDNGLKADFKEDLFKAIICTFGLGAKTNVGYGQFVEPEK
ncbi:type III-B CRISPR module RAMP protein Cmr6 [Porphyromonas gingivalis]|uniref:CRISPR type III-associated protein domain-containing protein n=1 Tax=Porphyromonas gingivalis (strain ATCC 33277 / DSM 20709 / CIP 103683 / JCM 12257 / NCTC 11834 / 2561) TaxID=431947 RepID=B2RM52_PORG3|nr:type III-B CRISPR module RAMP protein Cmr6 [Porphyromonas gingivalis]AIJ34706.1 CRISPR-associated protein Cmr5 [Porphyromonas gingivalis]ALJ26316.1 CRISPR-associated protein, Cmr6 family [Porphyromonas gingivalis 381]AUR50093.1 CRISPR-associated RAMP Cmr6 [Porphyromonas gingivalis ATCC 33277]MDR4975664.1 type III-B CRISPR module RAMP protein Cmr6 [Porphyromonas gingivalis]SJL20237.1 CRISPR-associated Cmr5 family protein [Porphyromonas gingivalis]